MISAAILVLIAAFLMTQSNDDSLNILSDVKKGEFVVDITTTGELEAKNSVEIQGPKGLRLYRIWQVTIQ